MLGPELRLWQIGGACLAERSVRRPGYGLRPSLVHEISEVRVINELFALPAHQRVGEIKKNKTLSRAREMADVLPPTTFTAQSGGVEQHRTALRAHAPFVCGSSGILANTRVVR